MKSQILNSGRRPFVAALATIAVGLILFDQLGRQGSFETAERQVRILFMGYYGKFGKWPTDLDRALAACKVADARRTFEKHTRAQGVQAYITETPQGARLMINAPTLWRSSSTLLSCETNDACTRLARFF